MNLDSLYRAGVKRAWTQDYEAQKQYTDIITQARGMKLNPFRKVNGIFIPNDEYMIKYFGEDIKSSEYGCYSFDGLCNWNNCLILPIVNVADKVAGFVSFNPFKYLEAKETHDWSIYYYAYSGKDVFSKSNYLYMQDGVYEKALQDGCLLLVDGVFDEISLHLAGFNAAALLGSSVSPQIIMLLRFVKRIILLVDNDEAGILLLQKLQKQHPNVQVFTQSIGKDADDALKSNRREEYIKELSKFIQDGNLKAITSFR